MKARSHQSNEDFWVFAYGSLMWRPGFDFLERRKPPRIANALAQQPRTLPQRLLIGADARSVRRIETKHEAIEKPPPAPRTLDEQAVHRRG